MACIDGVTDTDVRGFAEKMATEARPAMALYGPVKGAPELTTLQEWRKAG